MNEPISGRSMLAEVLEEECGRLLPGASGARRGVYAASATFQCAMVITAPVSLWAAYVRCLACPSRPVASRSGMRFACGCCARLPAGRPGLVFDACSDETRVFSPSLRTVRHRGAGKGRPITEVGSREGTEVGSRGAPRLLRAGPEVVPRRHRGCSERATGLFRKGPEVVPRRHRGCS